VTRPALLRDAIDVRRADANDVDALLALHHVGFGSSWGPTHWRWRYLDNPLRQTAIVGAFAPDGRCLASFCGVPLPCLYRGQRARVLRSGDVVVHPLLRQSVAGSSVLLRVANAYFDAFGGGDARVAFGFPHPGLSRTLVRHCRLEVMADVLLLVRDAAQLPARSAMKTATRAGLPADADALLRRWSADVTTGIVRDERYLRWRYQDNPHADYTLVTARGQDDELRGVAIARPSTEHPDALLVAEWIAPRDDDESSAALLAALRDVADAHGRSSVALSTSTSRPEFTELQARHGFRAVATPYQFVYRSFSSDIDRAFLFENWYHSFGDMDFV